MKRLLGFFLIVALLGLMQPASAADIKVMTQNQYLGADLTPLLTASSPAMFNALAVAALQQVAAGRPAERIKALAAEIAKEAPMLVGLQEVYQFDCAESEAISGQGCDDPTIRGAFGDHLQATLTALNGAYTAPAKVTNLNLPAIPLFVNGSWISGGGRGPGRDPGT